VHLCLLHIRTTPSARLTAAFVLLIAARSGSAQRFFPDDPLWQEPPPINVGKVEVQQLDNLVDFYKNSFYEKGDRHRPGHVYPSQGVNTLGEVPDNAWYTNRHVQQRLSLSEFARGPNVTGPPEPGGRWEVMSAKVEGVTPGFTIRDSRRRRYLLKFDPPENSELATGADVVSAKFLYALGYNVPENYIVRFRRDQLHPGERVQYRDRYGEERTLRQQDIDDLLAKAVPNEDGTYRASASFYISGEPVGPFKYYKWRADDPNEIAPHEHLRVLRGLYVFAAWLNHTDAKSLNSLDVVVEEQGRRFIKHYLIDFGASLGSDSLFAKDPRRGQEYFLDWRPGLAQLLTFGLNVPGYARMSYPDDPAVGNFGVEAFDPDDWKPNYPNAAFANRLPGDEFWAAKQVVRFTDEEIRAIVATAEYSKPESVDTISRVLSARRDSIGRTLLTKLLPLDNFRIENGRLVFDDLGVNFAKRTAVEYEVEWARFSNADNKAIPLAGRSGATLPAEMTSAASGSYWVAAIRNREHKNSARVYLRKGQKGWAVVGIDREGENDWVAR
jgi:hypothetical protein